MHIYLYIYYVNICVQSEHVCNEHARGMLQLVLHGAAGINPNLPLAWEVSAPDPSSINNVTQPLY